jgi:prepilin-type N-terminal cleavage/methylation domain-containing protein
VRDDVTRPLPDPRRADGFTLVEMLVTMVVSLIVFGAAMSFVLVTQRTSADVSDRVEAQQRGRTAMTQMIELLRSQTCGPAGEPAVVTATDTSLTFYADDRRVVAGAFGNADPLPVRHRLSYVAGAAGAPGSIEDERWSAAGVPPAPVTYPGPAAIRTVVTGVRPTASDPAVFHYFRLAATPQLFAPIPAPAAADLPFLSKVEIRFTASAGPNRPAASTSADLSGSSFSRQANPALPNEALSCT